MWFQTPLHRTAVCPQPAGSLQVCVTARISLGSTIRFLATGWVSEVWFPAAILKISAHRALPVGFEWPEGILTYLLTPWCRVLPEQLTGLQLVKKFPAFHGA